MERKMELRMDENGRELSVRVGLVKACMRTHTPVLRFTFACIRVHS